MNGLPNININFGNGALGSIAQSKDGLLCLAVCGVATVQNKFEPGNAYSIRKLDDLENLGITEVNNALLYQTVADFYSEVTEGTQVFIAGFGDIAMSEALDKTKSNLKKIIEQTNGELRAIAITGVVKDADKKLDADGNFKDVLIADIAQAKLKAQELAQWATDAHYAPLFVLIDGACYNGNATALPDLKKESNNRVGIIIGSKIPNNPNQAIGYIAGRLAKTSVDINIGQVSDGSLKVLELFAGKEKIETADVATIYEKGYISFRTYTGKSGYFINDGLLATADKDDYRQITARRTIDKAYRLAYYILLDRLLSKIPVKADGTLSVPMAKSWETTISGFIAESMKGELSDSDGDRGVICLIDPQQDILATSKLNVELRVRPFGYARYIDVLLGFTIKSK